MSVFDALSTENVEMVWTVEVFDSLLMILAKFLFNTILTHILIKVNLRQYFVILHCLVQDVDVQWELFDSLEVLNKFSAYWASHSKVMVQLRKTLSAESVSAMDKDPWDSFSDIVLQTTEVAEVHVSWSIIHLY